MRRRLVFWSCLFPVLAVTVGSGSHFASKSSAGNQGRTQPPETPVTIPALTKDFGRIPIYFVPYQSQTDDPVSFFIHGADKNIYFTPDGVTFSLSYSTELRDEKGEKQKEKDLKRWTVMLDLVGARKDVKLEGLNKTGAVVSYFKGKPEEWKTGLPTYSKIFYRDLWPGIDLVYMGEVDRLKYEFIVHPGADPAQIRLAYRGTKRVEVTEEGRLQMTTPAGIFEDDIPVAYQEVEGKRTNVGVAYVLHDPAASEGPEFFSSPGDIPKVTPEGQGYVYGFQVEEYDQNRTLVLDPAVLVYCGFIGGGISCELNVGTGIAVDKSGNAYISGYTCTSADFPVKVGPDLSHNGDNDAFVAKVNASGTELIYCGFIGGSLNEGWSDRVMVALDDAGNAYVTGKTESHEATFPVRVGPDLTHNGGADVFVAKVNSTGTGLVYCGYVGGSNGESSWGIAVDKAGNAYITGTTESTQVTFPVKAGPDLTYNGKGESFFGGDAFVAKVNSSGSGLVYCGYIGGSANEFGYGIAVDDAGNAYVTGDAESTESTFPVKVGPDLTYNGGDRDAFVAKVSPSGTELIYCGYVGGSGGGRIERGTGIDVDNAGNAYITGSTNSTEASFPVTIGPDLTFNGPGWDAYVAMINSSGNALVYCGYIGGSGEESSKGISIDDSGNAYISGHTNGSNEATFPVVNGPDLSYNGFYDAFVAKVSSSGVGLIYCGYIGGSDWDVAEGIAVDGLGSAYVIGHTFSTEDTFPVLIGPDLTYNGGRNIFAAKVSPSGPSFSISASPPSQTVTAGQSASYTIQVTPEGGPFNSSVSFSCSDLPIKCTASFSPASITPGANTAYSTLTLTTQAISTAGATLGAIDFLPPAPSLILVILVFFSWLSFRKPIRKESVRRSLAAGALACLIVLLAGCGTKGDGTGNNNNPPKSGTPTGTYKISVKGESGSLTATTSVTLVVQ